MRMATRFVNEAALCLQDGIVDTPVVGGTFAARRGAVVARRGAVVVAHAFVSP